ncbi:D-glycero-alpha-D-manno-heptose-1,7-bisphosphate 7-phosphatase [Leptolyngbya ohadii]|uniref:D-glycero-alpha-D-manno-heptose-1,7-bisphosphate 7-phosphatase n=1 Tax=Leptolyngbya ohadii TaxID=1962290 RepID=UPI000B59E6F0|nr:HAD family hydrolase [Leptolyngbya ohadii]
MQNPSAKAVFLDKDGTLIKDVPYNVDPNLIRWSDGAIEALHQLHIAGYKLFVITNQSGVARGYFEEKALAIVEQHLTQELARFGIPLAGFYYCPHHPQGTIAPYAMNCFCRKPEPGLILRAAADHQIDLSQSWFIGDILNDVAAGRSAGCRTILMDNGNETEWELSPARLPHHLASDLQTAARVILAVDHTDISLPFSDSSSLTVPCR